MTESSVTGPRFGLQPPGQPAPEWSTSEWFNTDRTDRTDGPLRLADLRGKVVVLHTFQMLCRGCVHQALPQAQRIREAFAPHDVAVIGLHTVFEHHAAMTPISLKAFLHENRIAYPVGVDAAGTDPNDPIPSTMRMYGMQGTPTMLLVDRGGHLRRHSFGVEDDIAVGAAIASLVIEGR